MLKTLNTKSAEPRKSIVGVSSDSKARVDRGKPDGNEINNSEVDGDEIGENEVKKKSQKTSKSKNLFKFKNFFQSKTTVGSDFFTHRARLAFAKLRQMFVKVPIFYHFDPEGHI